MLTVIIDARRSTDGLIPLLAQLATGVVANVLRQAIIVTHEDLGEILEASGAVAAPSFEIAGELARADWALVVPCAMQLQDDWIVKVQRWSATGVREALIPGVRPGRLRLKPWGLIVQRHQLGGAEDLAGLRRRITWRVARIG